MLLGAIADNFTGGSDLGNTLANGGMRAVQFVGVPEKTATADCKSAVVSLNAASPAHQGKPDHLRSVSWAAHVSSIPVQLHRLDEKDHVFWMS